MAKATILIPPGLHPATEARLAGQFDIIHIAKTDPALVTPAMAGRVRGIACMAVISADLIDALPHLQIIANFGVGYDAVDAAHAAKRGIMVTNTPDVLTEEVADLAVGLLINTVRELPKAEEWLRSGRWAGEGNYPLSRLTLRGRSVGILGLGRIGKAIARRIEAFGLPVSYHNRSKAGDITYPYYPTLAGLAEAVDTLISVAPGGTRTDKIVNAEILTALGPNGVFVNVGRGSTVDETALADALADGTIAAAGLDVFADEPNVPDDLLARGNASLLPHLGSASIATREQMAFLVADNLISWFAGKGPLTPVAETAALRVG